MMKDAVLRLLKKAPLDSNALKSYQAVDNIPFLCKRLKDVAAIQTLVGEMDYVDPFQPEFRPGLGIEISLIAQIGDFHQEGDRRNPFLLILLDLLIGFDTIDHGILMERLARL